MYKGYTMHNLNKVGQWIKKKQDLSIWENYLKCFFKAKTGNLKACISKKNKLYTVLNGLAMACRWICLFILFVVHKIIQITMKILHSFYPRELKLIAKWYKTVQFWYSKTTVIKWWKKLHVWWCDKKETKPIACWHRLHKLTFHLNIIRNLLLYFLHEVLSPPLVYDFLRLFLNGILKSFVIPPLLTPLPVQPLGFTKHRE